MTFDLMKSLQRVADDERVDFHARGTCEAAIAEIDRLRTALKPFAAFAEKAEAFVEARAKDNGSPILPSKDFRLADFQRARAALSVPEQREKS